MATTTCDHRQLSRGLRILTLTISSLVLLTAAVVAGLAVVLPRFIEGQKPAFSLFGFELVVLAAATLGVLVGMGRLRSAPGMTLACIGATMLAASALGWQGAGRTLGGVSLLPLLALRTLAALGILAGSLWATIGHDRAAQRALGLGGLLGLPVLIAAAAVVYPAGRRMLDALLAGGSPAALGAAALCLVILGGLIAASVHIIVGAFDRAVGD